MGRTATETTRRATNPQKTTPAQNEYCAFGCRGVPGQGVGRWECKARACKAGSTVGCHDCKGEYEITQSIAECAGAGSVRL